MPAICLTRAIMTDRTGLLGATGAALAGLPPTAVYGYLFARLAVPVVLIFIGSRGATPTQRISLIRDYLILAEQRSRPSRPNVGPAKPRSLARRTNDS